MLHDPALVGDFFALLTDLDRQLAQAVASAGCPRCGGRLHQGNYERKPRGGGFAVAAESFRVRFSLCCGREGCRRRTLPPSLRFLGRRVYVEAVVLLATATAQVVGFGKAARARTGVPCRTLKRWGTWWREEFPATRSWQHLQAIVAPPPPDEEQLPLSWLERLDTELGRGPLDEAPTTASVCLIAARLLAPLTTRSLGDVSPFVRGSGQLSALLDATQKMTIPQDFGVA